jgi:hypothetical protein
MNKLGKLTIYDGTMKAFVANKTKLSEEFITSEIAEFYQELRNLLTSNQEQEYFEVEINQCAETYNNNPHELKLLTLSECSKDDNFMAFFADEIIMPFIVFYWKRFLNPANPANSIIIH